MEPDSHAQDMQAIGYLFTYFIQIMLGQDSYKDHKTKTKELFLDYICLTQLDLKKQEIALPKPADGNMTPFSG